MGSALVLEIAQFDEKIHILGIHQLDALAQFVERLAIETGARRVGVGIVAIRYHTESCRAQPCPGLAELSARQRQRSQRSSRRFQKCPASNHPIPPETVVDSRSILVHCRVSVNTRTDHLYSSELALQGKQIAVFAVLIWYITRDRLSAMLLGSVGVKQRL
jgi:hypothetical protein